MISQMINNFKRPELSDAERQQVVLIAEAIVSLEGHPGWEHFKKAAEELARISTPRPTHFNDQESTELASKLTFVSGIHACLGLMDKQKENLRTLKKL